MQVIRTEGKNKEEALYKALQKLNAGAQEIVFSLQEEKSNLFKGNKYKLTAVTKYDVKAFIKSYLTNLANLMNTKFAIEISDDDGFNVMLTTDDNAIFIGKSGKNLNSIQIILRETIKTKTNFDIRINLDVAGYKVKKDNKLSKEIEKLAQEVLDTKIDVKLDPMNSYDRRIVHNVISEYDHLVTESIGENPNRYVVIKYKKD